MSKYTVIKECCASNGPGLRTAVWLSGCPGVWKQDDKLVHCPGCFNTQAWDNNTGEEFTDEVIQQILDSIEDSHVAGLSILGGEPLALYNQKATLRLVEKFRERFGNNKTIWVWSGYIVGDTLPMTADAKDILKTIDVLIDGPFIQELFQDGLVNMGSTNQRELHHEDLLKLI